MIYSSITPYVHMLRTGADEEEHVCLDFSSRGARGQYGYGDDGGASGFRVVSAGYWLMSLDLEYTVLRRR
jgi:hypothetical protein